MSDKTVLERAFELAADGRHRKVSEIQATLRREGYENVLSHLAGMTIKKQLQARIAAEAKVS